MEEKEFENENENGAQTEPSSQEGASEATSEKETPKKKRKYIQVLPYVLVLIPSVTLGVFGGLEIKKFFGPTAEVDYSSVDTKSLYPNYAKVEERYKKAAGTGTDFIHTLTPTEMAESAFCLIQKEQHVYGQGIGLATAAAGVNQHIRSTTIQKGDLFFEESISRSNFVDIADRMYQVPNGEDCFVTMHTGKTKGGNVNEGEYAETGTQYTGEEYIAHMGRLLSTPTSYIVSEKTVITGNQKTENMYGVTSAKKNGDGTYLVDIELDPILGVSAYVVQMQTISSLLSKPSFSYCHLTFELDKDLNLLAVTSYESYVAAVWQMGLKVQSAVTGKMRVTYERGGDWDIPELSTPCSYRSEM